MDSLIATRSYLDDTLLAALNMHQEPVKMVESLITRGANPNAKHSSGYSALMFACRAGHTETAKLLISHLDVSALNEYDKDGNTALMVAADYGRKDIVAALINAGADLFKQNIYLEDALEFATKGGEEASNDVAFQLFSAMSPYERNDAPYKGLISYRLFGIPASQENAQALIRYQAVETELRQRVINISAGLSAGQNPQNNLGRMTDLLALIAEYAFDNCLVNGHARREVMEAMRTITPRPSLMFSMGQLLAPLHRRVSNLATNVMESAARRFIHVASIPSVMPCPVPAIEDERAEQGPTKKARK